MTPYKQPHEDITGIDRSDSDLLSLDPQATAHRTALQAMAQYMSRVARLGNRSEVAQQMQQRIENPRPGDLVAEISVPITSRVPARPNALGYLIEQRREWGEYDTEWEQEKADDGTLDDGDRTTDTAWYIQYGPQATDVCRWTNCEFVVIPDHRDMEEAWGIR